MKKINVTMPSLGEMEISLPTIKVQCSEPKLDELQQKLQSFCISIRKQSNNEIRKKSKSIVSEDIRIGFLNNKPTNRYVLSLLPAGCQWCKDGGGCIMCGHFMASSNQPISIKEIEQRIKEIRNINNDNIILCIYNGGSILNPKEMKLDTLIKICKSVSKNQSIKQLVLETRAEYISKTVITQIKATLRNDQSLIIGTGIETTNDIINKLCFNKGLSYQNFLQLTKNTKSLIRGYIFFGAPFLTELEMISDCYNSIIEVSKIGLNEIHLETATIQQKTPLAKLWKNDLYELPSLWSLIALLKIIPKEIKIYVSPFIYFPMPKYAPTSCSKCNATIHDTLSQYNITGNTEIFDKINCQCIDSWIDQISKKNTTSLEIRLEQAMTEMGL